MSVFIEPCLHILEESPIETWLNPKLFNLSSALTKPHSESLSSEVDPGTISSAIYKETLVFVPDFCGGVASSGRNVTRANLSRLRIPRDAYGTGCSREISAESLGGVQLAVGSV